MENNFYMPALVGPYQQSSNGVILSYLLGSLFGGWGSSIVYPTLPDVSSEALHSYLEESKDKTDEEKKELIKKYLDPDCLLEKYFKKLKNPIQAAKLNAKLMKLDAKIAVINQKKQDIVNEWVKS